MNAHELLRFVGLEQVAAAPARSLPYGDQRRVEIARALASEPRLLLLDEPAAGMNPAETDALVALLRSIRERGTTLLLIEHDMNLVMSVSDRITVLNFGQHIAEGRPAEIARNPDVITAYLGGRSMLLEMRDLVRGYGGRSAPRHLARRRRGRDRLAARRERAGKSTTLKVISRVIPPASGEVRFDGRSLDGLDPEDVVALGIAHVPEGPAHLSGAHHAGQPAPRRDRAARAAPRSSATPTKCSRSSPKLRGLAGKLGAGRSRAASSRCSRSRAA